MLGGQQPSVSGGQEADVSGGREGDVSGGRGPSVSGGQQPSVSGGQEATVSRRHRSTPPREPQHRPRPRSGRRSHLHLAHPPRLRLAHQPDVVVARLTGEPPPTDSSHALKTGYDLERDAWPYTALAELGLPDGLLPDVVRPGTRLGEVCPAAAEATGIPVGTPVVAGMTDGCAAQIASGALRPGAWNSVLGTTLVLKGAATAPVHDPTGVVYNHRAPDGSWLPGGASSVGAGVLTAAFAGADPAAMDARAAAYEPSGAVAYPLVSPGERFPFRAPQASAVLLGEPRGDADLWAALLQGVAFTERLCLDYLHHLGAPLDGPLTFTGGGARSPYWNQLRVDILGRPARVPAQTEPALGMAALAAYGTGEGSLADITDRMVRIETTLDPHPSRTALFAEPYARLVGELTARGWLPEPVAAHAHSRLGLDTSGS
ncbi:FGGY-family carbohydrate kinase [Streptomyces sp. NPDC001617]